MKARACGRELALMPFKLKFCHFYLCNRFDASQSRSIPDCRDVVGTCNPNEWCCSAALPTPRMVRKPLNRCQFWCESMEDCRLFKANGTLKSSLCQTRLDERTEIKLLPEKLVSRVVGTQDGMRGAQSPFEQSTLLSPSNLYNPKSLQRAWSEWPCGTAHPTFFCFVMDENENKKFIAK